MAFSVNTNVSAMAALRTLSITQSALNGTQRQIETGLKVAEAKDDPSTFTIAQGMRGDVGSLKAIQEGLSFGQATVNMANAGALQISNTIIDLNKKVTQSLNQGLDITVLQKEADALVEQITSIVDTTVFNGVNLIDGSGTDLEVLSALGGVTQTVTSQDARINTLGIDDFSLTANASVITVDNNFTIADEHTYQITLTDDAGTVTAIHRFEITTGSSALTGVMDENATPPEFLYPVTVVAGQSVQEMTGTLATSMREEGFAVKIGETGKITIAHGQNVSTAIYNATTSANLIPSIVAAVDNTGNDPLAVLENAERLVGEIITNLGTAANRLESQSEFTQLLVDKLEEGLGILVDANLAEASAQLQALQTKEQLGIQSLSIANQRPQSILSLFQ